MFKEYLKEASPEMPRNSRHEEDNMRLIQIKLGELVNNITKFEGEPTALVDKSQYYTFMNTNNALINGIEELMRKEMGCAQEDNKTAMLRFQKVLSQQKKKIKSFSLRSWHFLEEEEKQHYEEPENEAAGLLTNEVTLEKFDDFESFVQDRNTRIASVLKGMQVTNKICKDIALMTQEQSENVLVIHQNIDNAEDRVKKANKELSKTKHFTGINRKRYVRLLIFLFVALLFTFYLIHHWKMKALAQAPQA